MNAVSGAEAREDESKRGRTSGRRRLTFVIILLGVGAEADLAKRESCLSRGVFFKVYTVSLVLRF